MPQRFLNPPGMAGTDLHHAAPLPSFGVLCLWYFLMPIKSHLSPSPRRLTSRPCAIFCLFCSFCPQGCPCFTVGALLEGVLNSLPWKPFPCCSVAKMQLSGVGFCSASNLLNARLPDWSLPGANRCSQ